MRIRWNQVAGALLVLQTSVLAGSDIGPAYTIQRVGLSTPEFFNSAGQQNSFGPGRVADRLAGGSYQYFGNTNPVGAVPYVHNISTGLSSPIGLMDAAHTGPNGQRYGSISSGNQSGFIVGNSTNYSQIGTVPFEIGQSAWAHDIATGVTTRIGFYDAAHTAANGFQLSESQQIGPAMWAAGRSRRYSGVQQSGETAWVYNIANGAIREVGLTGPEFVGTSGGPFSQPVVFARTGLLIGKTERFVGSSTSQNFAAWIHDPANNTTRRIGLTDADHTAVDGLAIQSGFPGFYRPGFDAAVRRVNAAQRLRRRRAHRMDIQPGKRCLARVRRADRFAVRVDYRCPIDFHL